MPEYYNIGVDACDKWAHDSSRLALIYETPDGQTERYTFADLRNLSNRFGNALRHNGIAPGDRVGILLGQRPETAISHLAIYKLGSVAVPLFTLFGIDALEYRLAHSGAKAVITDTENEEKLLSIKDSLPDLEVVAVVGSGKREGRFDFWDLVRKGSESFQPVNTRADDPALIIYTSGTTGPPKGALHAHRVLLGHLPGVEFPQNLFPKEGDLFWTPADWAWIGGLIDALLPSWHHGIPVVAYRARKFDPEQAFHLIAKHGIRNAFIPPTALKMMRLIPSPRDRFGFQMRSIGSGGETLGEELLEWGKMELGVAINEFYGQTEANLVLGNCSDVMEIRPGSMGRAVPGHVVEVVDPSGKPVQIGTVGEVAVRKPDPVMFLGYWANPQATLDKFAGEWCMTGDLARKDAEGYFWFVGRKDDLITSAGYRIGPAEIEDCLLKHESVSMAAVVGSPDELRTEIVKAFIVPKPGVTADEKLVKEIQEFVKVRLAAHEFPREIEFVTELPMTATGKIVRRELRRLEMERKAAASGSQGPNNTMSGCNKIDGE